MRIVLEMKKDIYNMIIGPILASRITKNWKIAKMFNWVPFWNNRLQVLTKIQQKVDFRKDHPKPNQKHIYIILVWPIFPKLSSFQFLAFFWKNSTFDFAKFGQILLRLFRIYSRSCWKFSKYIRLIYRIIHWIISS